MYKKTFLASIVVFIGLAAALSIERETVAGTSSTSSPDGNWQLNLRLVEFSTMFHTRYILDADLVHRSRRDWDVKTSIPVNDANAVMISDKNPEHPVTWADDSSSATQQPETEPDWKQLVNRIENTIGDDWTETGLFRCQVKTGDLVEVEPSAGEFVLSMQLIRQDQVLATQKRFFALFQGSDAELTGPPITFLVCEMHPNGFLSGSCQLTNISSTQVSVTADWTFDDRKTNIESVFDKSFVAILGETGSVECSGTAWIDWKFDQHSD